MADSDSDYESIRLQNVIKQTEKQKADGVKFIVGGIAALIVWCIAFFVPAIWTNFIVLIIAGLFSVGYGAYQVYAATKKLEELQRK